MADDRSVLEGHLFCSACGEPAEPTEEFVSVCCWEPLQNEHGVGLTIEIIMQYMDENEAFHEEQAERYRRDDED